MRPTPAIYQNQQLNRAKRSPNVFLSSNDSLFTTSKIERGMQHHLTLATKVGGGRRRWQHAASKRGGDELAVTWASAVHEGGGGGRRWGGAPGTSAWASAAAHRSGAPARLWAACHGRRDRRR
jgi:hypothetical protein